MGFITKKATAKHNNIMHISLTVVKSHFLIQPTAACLNAAPENNFKKIFRHIIKQHSEIDKLVTLLLQRGRAILYVLA